MSWGNLHKSLASLYSESSAAEIISSLQSLSGRSLSANQKHDSNSPMLICYADSIISKNTDSPLNALTAFIKEKEFSSFMPQVHLLPFFPWDTDRGFSVKNYYEVDSRNGNWDDVKELSDEVDLMFDFVANHASIENPVVQSALIAEHLNSNHEKLKEHLTYKDFVICYSSEGRPKDEELSSLSRPRANPVLTPYSVLENNDGTFFAKLGKINIDFDGKEIGKGFVWTTFSRGKNKENLEQTRQVDLNFKNPEVFLESIKIILFYLEKGASLVRLDAIGYLWKILSSSSIHEKETHLLIHCMYQTLELLEIPVKTIAEVNESQENVIPYLGTAEKPEADYIYQFTHFPLAVHAFTFNTSKYYSSWIDTVEETRGKQFVTVLGSHDGLGMKPLRGVLPEEEIEKLAEHLANENEALANYAVLPGGRKIIYEICATPWDIVNAPNEDNDIKIEKYLSIIRLGLLQRGIPGFYINGLIASRNYLPSKGLDENRTINREQFELEKLIKTLAEDSSGNAIQAQVFEKIKNTLQIRAKEAAFESNAPALKSLDYKDKSIIAVNVPATNHVYDILSVSNVSAELKTISLGEGQAVDILSDQAHELSSVTIKPFQTLWLKNTAAKKVA